MKMRYWIFPLVVMASGCAASTTPVSANATAQKGATAICATTGAALQAMVVAGATKAIQGIKPEAEVLEPICTQSSPSGAVTSAEAKAYEGIVAAAAPYMGGAQ